MELSLKHIHKDNRCSIWWWWWLGDIKCQYNKHQKFTNSQKKKMDFHWRWLPWLLEEVAYSIFKNNILTFTSLWIIVIISGVLSLALLISLGICIAKWKKRRDFRRSPKVSCRLHFRCFVIKIRQHSGLIIHYLWIGRRQCYLIKKPFCCILKCYIQL